MTKLLASSFHVLILGCRCPNHSRACPKRLRRNNIIKYVWSNWCPCTQYEILSHVLLDLPFPYIFWSLEHSNFEGKVACICFDQRDKYIFLLWSMFSLFHSILYWRIFILMLAFVVSMYPWVIVMCLLCLQLLWCIDVLCLF